MSNFEQKPNTGNAWINDFKKADNHPDFKGKFTDDQGNLKDIALWKRKDKNDKTYVYFAISEQFIKPEEKVVTEQSGYDKAKAQADSLRDTTDYDEPISLENIPF